MSPITDMAPLGPQFTSAAAAQQAQPNFGLIQGNLKGASMPEKYYITPAGDGPSGPVDPGYGRPVLPPIAIPPLPPGVPPSQLPIVPPSQLPIQPPVMGPPIVIPEPPPVIGGGPVVPPTVGGGPVVPPSQLPEAPPGTIWPPLPPGTGIAGKALVLIYVVGVGSRWLVVDGPDMWPPNKPVEPPSAGPKSRN